MTPDVKQEANINQRVDSSVSEQPMNQPAKQKKYRKILFICTIIILIIPVFGFIMAFISKPKLSSNPLENPAILKLAEKLPIPKITMETITIAPTSSVPDTSNFSISPLPLPESWNTYNNSEIKFSVQYPSGMKVKEDSHGLGVVEISINSPENTDPNTIPDYQILTYPKTVGKLIGQDFDQLYNIPPQTTQRLTSEGNPPNLFTKIKNTTINSLRAFEYTSTSDPPNPSEQAEVGFYIESGNNTIIITTGEDNQAIVEHIVSTFKQN